MSFDRAERTGFGMAFAGHVLLFALLSAGYFAVRTPLRLERKPIEVSLVDETGLESGAPQISTVPPAPKLAEVEGPVEPVSSPVPEVVPTPAPPAPTPAPAPRPSPRVAKPETKAAPAPPTQKTSASKTAPSRPTGRLKGLLTGVSGQDSDSQTTAPPAATITAAVQSSLAAEVRRQIKPFWEPPTGADAELLRTTLRIFLARDGSVTKLEFVDTTGVNASNRPQAQLHRERAIKAVRLASPFKLPVKFYDGWKSMTVNLDLRLST